MSNNITIKKSSVPGKVPQPADLLYGELALNYSDGALYYKKSDNTIGVLSSGSIVSSVGITSTDLTVTGSPITSSGDISLSLNTVPVVKGGTGATSEADARQNLGLEIGVDVQAYDAVLTSWASKSVPTGDVLGTTDTQILTNKTIDGSTNTLSNISNSSLTNSSITINGSAISLGGEITIDPIPVQTNNEGKILVTNGTEPNWANISLTNLVYVAKNGVDARADGSINNPFSTISAALSYIDAAYPVTVSSGTHVAIMISPGTYDESITVTRPKTHFIGLEGKSKTVRINGTFTYNPTVLANNSIYETAITVNKIFFINATSTANTFVVTGSIANSVEINDCYLYSTGTGIPLLINNTADGGNRLRVVNSDFTAIGNAAAIDITNLSNASVNGMTISSGSTTDAVKIASSTVTIGFIVASTTTATNVISIDGGIVTIGNSSISSSKSNGSGIYITTGTQLIVTTTVYNIPLGTGYVVNGQSDSYYIYGGNNAVYGTNSLVGANVINLPMSSTVNANDISGTLLLANGGTGATDAATARTNLGLEIGVDVQAYDADLTSWSGKTAPTGDAVGTSDTQTLTNKTIDGSNNTITNVSLTTGVSGILPIASGGTNASTASDARQNLGLEIGVDVQAYSATLTSWASKSVPTGDVLGTTDTQTLTNKTIDGSSNTITNISLSSVTDVLPIANGGTGQTNAADAINALVPSQTGNSGKYLTTNGASVSWDDPIFKTTFTATQVIANQIIDSVNASSYSSIKYTVEAKYNSKIQLEEILVTHDGVDTFIVRYGKILTDNATGDLVSYGASLSNGTLNLVTTPANANTEYKIVRITV